MKRLVLAEKPSVGRDIARVLGCKKETHSYIEGNDHIVTWALGHLVSLADPEQYGKEYKEWNMDVLPMMPKHWKLTVLKKTSKQFQTVKKILLRNEYQRCDYCNRCRKRRRISCQMDLTDVWK